jgi:hypothetical protein
VIDTSSANSFEVSATNASIIRLIDENNSDNVDDDDDFKIIVLEKKSIFILNVTNKTKETFVALKSKITIKNMLIKSMMFARLK